MERIQLHWCAAFWLAGLFFASALPAAEFRHDKQAVKIAADEVLDDDLYVASEDVVIEGTIKGDLFAAGKNVTINGTVQGNVFAVGQSITVKGTVEGDLFAAGQGVLIEGKVYDDARIAGEVVELDKSGSIGGDMFAAGASLVFEEGSSVTTDTVVAAAQALVSGKLGRNLVGAMSNCQIAGEIGGNANVYIGDGATIPPQGFSGQPPPIAHPSVERGLSIGQDAKIGGKLTYKSVGDAEIANPAAITGGVEHVAVVPRPAAAPPPPPTIQEMVVSRVKMFAAVAIVGFVTVLILPRWTNDMAANLRHPVRLFFSIIGGPVGAVGFIVMMIVILVAMFVAALLFGLVQLDNMVGVSFGLGLFGSVTLAGFLWFAFWFLAPAVVCIFIGRLIGRSQTIPTIAAFLIGLIIVGILLSIPHAGFWIGVVISLLGLGAFCVWLVAGAPEEPVAMPVAK